MAGKRIPMRPDKKKPNESQVRDRCQTPAYALEPLLPYLVGKRFVWEPARGEGKLEDALHKAGFLVTSGDILTGQNFFAVTPPIVDCLVTNPPFSVKYPWIARCFEIGLPFALLIPVSSIGAVGCNALMRKHENDTGIILMDKRVDYHMPVAGESGSGAQFASLWLCYKLLPERIVYATLNKPKVKKSRLPEGVTQPVLFSEKETYA